MDFIWHEMHYAVVMRKTPPFAPYVMKLLCKKWKDADYGDLMKQCGRLTDHPMKDLTKKKHSQPRFGPGADEEEDESDEDPNKEEWVSKQKCLESDESSAEEFEPWTTSPPAAHGNDEDISEDDDIKDDE